MINPANPPDSDSFFGQYSPAGIIGALTSFSQTLPHNWFGKQMGQLIQKIVLRHGKTPVDVTIKGIRMRCHLRDNASERKFVFMPWRFDEVELATLSAIMPPDGVFIDIGANVGIYSLAVASRLNGSGRIVALEPNPPAFSRLKFNIDANRAERQDWPSVTALQIGISDTEGEFAPRSPKSRWKQHCFPTSYKCWSGRHDSLQTIVDDP